MVNTKETRTMTDKQKIKVVVTRNVEPIDFDAWAARYVRAVLDAYEAKQQISEAA